MSTLNILSRNYRLFSSFGSRLPAKNQAHNVTLSNLSHLARPLSFPFRLTQTRSNSNHKSPPNQKQDKNNSNSKTGDNDVPEVKFVHMNITEEFKKLAVQYGPPFMVVHAGVCITSLSVIYLMVEFVINPADYIGGDWMNSSSYYLNSSWAKNGGNFVIAYATYKALILPRFLLTTAITRSLAPKIHNYYPKWLRNHPGITTTTKEGKDGEANASISGSSSSNSEKGKGNGAAS